MDTSTIIKLGLSAFKLVFKYLDSKEIHEKKGTETSEVSVGSDTTECAESQAKK